MTINSGDPSAAPLTEESDFASEQGAEFDVLREAYETARTERDRLINEPDHSIPPSHYLAKLKAAIAAVDVAHEAMLAAYHAPRIMLGLPDNEQDWKAIAAARVPIMVHTCDSEYYASAWNDGYETAVAQGLADDPSLASDWLDEKIRTAKAEVLRDAANTGWMAMLDLSRRKSMVPGADDFRDWLRGHGDSIGAGE